VPRNLARSSLRKGLQPKSSEVAEAGSRHPNSDRAVRRQHPSLHHGRTRRPVLCLYPGMGPHEHASSQGHRSGGGSGRRRLHQRRMRVVKLKEETKRLMNVTDKNSLPVFDPRGVVESTNTPIAARVNKLDGLRLAILDNSKWNANKILRTSTA